MKYLPEFHFFVMFTLSSEAHGFFTSVVDENQTPSWLHHAYCAYLACFSFIGPSKEKDATFVRKATIGETFKISALTYTLARPQPSVVCLEMWFCFALPSFYGWHVLQNF
jgi:hypothetical protein